MTYDDLKTQIADFLNRSDLTSKLDFFIDATEGELNRRLRTKESLRNLIRETSLHPHDFIAPLFVVEGSNIKQEITSMPNYYRLSLDNILVEIGRASCRERV